MRIPPPKHNAWHSSRHTRCRSFSSRQRALAGPISWEERIRVRSGAQRAMLNLQWEPRGLCADGGEAGPSWPLGTRRRPRAPRQAAAWRSPLPRPCRPRPGSGRAAAGRAAEEPSRPRPGRLLAGRPGTLACPQSGWPAASCG